MLVTQREFRISRLSAIKAVRPRGRSVLKCRVLLGFQGLLVVIAQGCETLVSIQCSNVMCFQADSDTLGPDA